MTLVPGAGHLVRGALALGPATPHDRFTVPAGLLSLLAVAAEEQPVLVAIDDVVRGLRVTVLDASAASSRPEG